MFQFDSPIMSRFDSEFRNLKYVIRKSEYVLLFAHTRPDPDSIGANLALKEALLRHGKRVDIACYDPCPDYLHPVIGTIDPFLHPDTIDAGSYDTVIASDSVDRGFHLFRDRISEDQVTAIIDHHPDIEVRADIKILDTESSSASELIYDFFIETEEPITPTIATSLLMGILFDTGNFQHPNTRAKTMEAASDLIRKGAKLKKIVETIFTNRDLSTLKIWGRALVKARIIPENNMIVSALTEKDIDECQASTEEVNQAIPLLNSVSDAKFAMLLVQKDPETIRASLRSDEEGAVDVSLLAKKFGGGGHAMASGFEIKGRIIETELGWQIA